MEIKKEVLDKVEKDDGVRYATVELKNRVELIGVIDSELELSYRTNHEGIYKFILKVPRLKKDVFDYLIIEAPERGMKIERFSMGDNVKVTGQFRSLNRREEGDTKSHMYLHIFAESIEPDDSDNKVNEIRLHGHLCKNPNFRVTRKGREICDLLLAVNRYYGRCDYIPCIAWGRDARFAKEFSTGQGFYIVGRIQSRNYHKRLEDGTVIEKTAYEVSAVEIRETEKDEIITEERIIS